MSTRDDSAAVEALYATGHWLLDAGRQLRREARGTGGIEARTLTPVERILTTLAAASVRVLEEILTLARLNRGRVFPSYDYLADATSLGLRIDIVYALNRVSRRVALPLSAAQTSL